MSYVNVDTAELNTISNNLQNAINSIDATKISLKTKYQHLGTDWNDKKYTELGSILQECNLALINIEKTLLQGQRYILSLLKYIQEYDELIITGNLNKDVSFSQYVTHAVRSIQHPTSSEVKGRLNAVGVRNVNLNGIPKANQEQIASAFETMAKEFPESIGCIDQLTVSLDMSPSTPASTGFSTSDGNVRTYMQVNPQWFANENLDSMIQNCIDSGQWAGSGIGGIINHEIGHAMHLQLDAAELNIDLGTFNENVFTNAGDLTFRWAYNTTTNNIRDTVLNNMGLTRDDICEQVSEYADTDGSECLAECIADVTTSNVPSQISINMINEYRRRLQNARNGGNIV